MGKFPFLRPAEDAGCFLVENPRSPQALDIRLFANQNVPFERESFEQLFDFLDVARAVADVREVERTRHDAPFFGDAEAGIDRVVLTPDFHKGSLVPVGTVFRARHMCIPRAIGNDICCGMRLLVTDLPAEALEPHWNAIQKRLRAIFFAGERDIPMSPRQREAVLRDGLPGLVRTAADNAGVGIWSRFDRSSAEEDLARAHAEGHFATRRLFGFERFVESSGNVDGRDPQIGCVGGGNHFVELQRIDALFDGPSARTWGLSKGNLAIMIHSGSVGLGHAVGGYFMDRAREIFPRTVKAPKDGFYPLPISGPRAEEGLFYLDGMGNAANFAFANRLFLGLMAVRAIEEAIGRTLATRLVYDAPHNLVFRDDDVCLHRKGATPAHGPTASDWVGKPVIIPGSMGAASFLLAGSGHEASLESACHGAGRALSRGRAAHVSRDVFVRETGALRIVGPIDPKSPALVRRRDLLARYEKRVMEEAPYAYKAVEPVVESVEHSGIARKVARLFPLCTVKG
ncbi:RtcB family protein [Labilithrix luteola]|uniref:RtcB family protein n=1 Tax=Labilithrix luteola TaxID=1391654 RepID=UPI0011BA587A|nr:RtcB family protein [Labilithrix luteola]